MSSRPPAGSPKGTIHFSFPQTNPPNIPGGGGAGTGIATPTGGPLSSQEGSGDNSVNIGKLQTHVTWLDRFLVAGAVALLGLAGTGWLLYKDLTNEILNLSVKQENLSGKIDTLDAKLSGKFDLMEMKLDARNTAQTSSQKQ